MKYIDEKNIKNFKKINTSSWNNIKNNIYLRLMNKKYIDKYDENIAYKSFLDLAIVFSLQEKTKNSMTSHMLTNEELIDFDIDIEEAFKTAIENSSNNRKKRILTFKEHGIKNHNLYPILKIPEDMMMCMSGDTPTECGVVFDTDKKLNCDNILIICNKNVPFGASYMVIPEVLDEVYTRFNYDNFYIVPLSIHHIMCIRYGYASDNGRKPLYEIEDDLLDMIEDFNDSKNKDWKDILSYKIYNYFGDDGKKLFIIK